MAKVIDPVRFSDLANAFFTCRNCKRHLDLDWNGNIIDPKKVAIEIAHNDMKGFTNCHMSRDRNRRVCVMFQLNQLSLDLTNELDQEILTIFQEKFEEETK